MPKSLSQYLNNYRLVGFVSLVLCSLYLWAAGDIYLDFWSEEEPFTARSMPYLIGSLGVAVSILLLVLPSPQYDWSVWRDLQFGKASLLLLTMGAYSVLIDQLGFLVASGLLLFCGFVILQERRFILAALIATAVATGFWILMDLLGIYLTPGQVWQDLW